MGMATGDDPRRALPSVEQVLRIPRIHDALSYTARGVVVAAIRTVLDRRRSSDPTLDGLEKEILDLVNPSLTRVINATGVIVHTNLGRAPLAPEALTAASQAAGYTWLEMDPRTGSRGSRQSHVQLALRALTTAEAACVVNTNAAAVLLALVALGGGGEIIVSRGELVEIGGGFRIPEVLEASGCTLVEVGTTNKTRISDYQRAIGSDTRAILRVHPSNYRVVGFTESPDLRELAQLAAANDLDLIDDLGSGALTDDAIYRGEPSVRAAVDAGVTVAAFSGDKLLGGPQCGVIVGTANAVERCASHPLMRALRPDKITLAALDATLRLHADPDRRSAIPTVRMLEARPEETHRRAERVAGAVGGSVVETAGRVGGGSLPTDEIPSYAVAMSSPDGAEVLAARLRSANPPVIGRIHDGVVLIDCLTVSDDEVDTLIGVLASTRE